MDSQPKFCGHCGKPLQAGQNFCANCGAKQDSQQVIGAQTGINVEAANNTIPTPKKPKKKLWIGIGVGIAVATITIVVVSLILSGTLNGKDRTIMVYMIGSDLESEAAAASLDINEMKDANFDPEHTKVLIYTGGTKKWALDEISEDENAIFEVTNGNINKVNTYEKILMTEPSNLTEFVNFAYENYPADMYDLILWDHGGGPIYGYGLDENSLSGTPMKISNMSEALSNTKLVGDGKKFDLIGFDACLMGSAEVAKALSNYSDYLIASEEVEPGDGWDYNFLNDLSTSRSVNNTKELGQSIIDHYISHYNDYAYDVDLSLAMVDLSKINKLSDSIDALFSGVKEEITAQTFSQYSRLMTRDKVYGYNGRESQSYDLVDLMDLCGSLKESHGDQISAIEKDFDDVVVYSQSNMNNTNGLSVYFLNYNKAEAERMLAEYKNVAFSDGYYDFLTKYKNFVTGDRVVARTVYSDLAEETTENGIEVELPDELVDNYQSGEVNIFRKLGENRFMPVYRSSEVELAGNKLRATTYKLQFVIEMHDEEGTEYGWSTFYEKERTATYADYVTYGVLYYDDNSDKYGFGVKNYEMYVRLPKGSDEGIVRDIRVSSDTELASKMSFDPEKIKTIDFMAGTYKLFNKAGELDYNMESYGILYGSGADIAAGDTYKIKLVGLDFDFGDMYGDEFSDLADYYAGFVVYDTQGDKHRLNLIHIDK